MWESADPPQTAQRRAAKPERSNGEYLLWAQLFLCGLVLAGVLAARRLEIPLYQHLRTGYAAVLQTREGDLLGEERELMKFAEQAATDLRMAAAEVFEQLQMASRPASSRTAHGKAAAPTGSSLQSYLPRFSLVFPLPEHSGENTSGYGWRTDPMGGQGTEFHTGVDWAAAQGTAVAAAADGVVRCAGWHSSYGNYVRILHADGDETLYAHMQYLFVRTGQQVTAGETLGTVGETGNATGPHLHFELLHKGVRYDPTQALEAAV